VCSGGKRTRTSLYLPKDIKCFPEPGDVPVVKEGWSCQGVTGVKGGTFKKSQRDFLLRLFNNNGRPKIRERDTHNRMMTTFNDKNVAAVNSVMDKGFTEVSQSIDMQDNNEEGGHDQNEGVPEEGEEEELPPPLPITMST
jgi:hypothetical protein